MRLVVSLVISDVILPHIIINQYYSNRFYNLLDYHLEVKIVFYIVPYLFIHVCLLI